MLAEDRRTSGNAPRGAVEQIRRARVAELAPELRMLDLDEEAARSELLVVEQRLGRADRRVGLAQKLGAFDQFFARVVFGPIVENVEKMLGHQGAMYHLVILGRFEIAGLAVGFDPFD